MNAKDIINRKFDKSTFSGYKTDDVDEFMRDVSVEFKALENENAELEKKLEVLANKIREYRNDEEALRDAILVAKREGINILNEAKADAEKRKADSIEAAAKKTKETDDLVAKKKEIAEKTIADAKAEAQRIVADAKNKADEIHTMMQQQTEREQIVLQRTRKEVSEYTAKILAAYKTHISYITALPQECENEFVVKTVKEVESRPANESAFAKPAAKPAAKPVEKKPEPQKPAEKAPAKAENKEDEPFKAVETEKTAEIKAKSETSPLFSLNDKKEEVKAGNK